MFTARARLHRRGGRAFTLIEITLAVAILGMMSLAIYRFVQTNLTALRVSSATNLSDAEYTAFANLLSTQWASLPAGVGALVGEPFKLNNRPRDEITWICGAGPGLMTRYAAGEYRVSMRLRPAQSGKETMEIGLMRDAFDDGKANDGTEGSWIPLLQNVESLKISYFDPRLNTWVEKWTDTLTLPRLVRVVIGRTDNSAPWEVVVPLARTPL
jgi:prepilin-type N-terminal cleavage/methylation domain-containing protein